VTVYLIGAGPGDPGLLTRRGGELLARADVVVYDRPSMAAIVDLAGPAAERLRVGRDGADHGLPQADVNALLVDLGRRHEVVVRLKSGDPFVVSRGGEEAMALAAAGVRFEVVPGISAAVAAPAYAGIPVTVRQVASTLTVVAGNDDPAYAQLVDWEALARVGGTIVVMTGRAAIRGIAERLVAAGMAAATPVAAISAGTRPRQRTLRGTLEALPRGRLPPPVTYVIGQVAGLDLAWFHPEGIEGAGAEARGGPGRPRTPSRVRAHGEGTRSDAPKAPAASQTEGGLRKGGPAPPCLEDGRAHS
jgi:uroporphyrin-III C-methyltransferase